MGDKAWYQDKIQRPVAHHLVGDVHGAVLGVAGLRKVCNGCLTPLLTLSGRILHGNCHDWQALARGGNLSAAQAACDQADAEPIEMCGEFEKSAPSIRPRYDLVGRVVATHRRDMLCLPYRDSRPWERRCEGANS